MKMRLDGRSARVNVLEIYKLDILDTSPVLRRISAPAMLFRAATVNDFRNFTEFGIPTDSGLHTVSQTVLGEHISTVLCWCRFCVLHLLLIVPHVSLLDVHDHVLSLSTLMGVCREREHKVPASASSDISPVLIGVPHLCASVKSHEGDTSIARNAHEHLSLGGCLLGCV